MAFSTALAAPVVLCLSLLMQMTFLKSYVFDLDKYPLMAGVELDKLTVGQNVKVVYDADSLVANLGDGSSAGDFITVNAVKRTVVLGKPVFVPLGSAIVGGTIAYTREKDTVSVAGIDCAAYLGGRASYRTTTSSLGYQLTPAPQATDCCRAARYVTRSECSLTARVKSIGVTLYTIQLCDMLPTVLVTGEPKEGNGAFPDMLPTSTPTHKVVLVRLAKLATDLVESLFGLRVDLSYPDPTGVHVRVRQTRSLTLPPTAFQIDDLFALISKSGAEAGAEPTVPPGLSGDIVDILQQMLGISGFPSIGNIASLTGGVVDIDFKALLAGSSLTNPPMGMLLNFSVGLPASAGLDLDIVFPELVCVDADGIACSVPRFPTGDDSQGVKGDADGRYYTRVPFYVTNLATTGLADLDLAIPKANEGLTHLFKKLIGFYLMPRFPCSAPPPSLATAADAGRCYLPLSSMADANKAGPTEAPPALPSGATPLADVALFQYMSKVVKSVETIFNISLVAEAVADTALRFSLETLGRVDISPLVALVKHKTGLGGSGNGNGAEEKSGTTLLAIAAYLFPDRFGGDADSRLASLLAQVRLRSDFLPVLADHVATIPRGATVALDVFVADVRCDAASGMDCSMKASKKNATGATVAYGVTAANLHALGFTFFDFLINNYAMGSLSPMITRLLDGLLSSLCGDGAAAPAADTWLVCDFMTTDGVPSKLITQPALAVPPLQPGTTAMSDVAVFDFAKNVLDDVESFGTFTLDMSDVGGTSVQLLLESHGSMDLFADHFADIRTMMRMLVQLIAGGDHDGSLSVVSLVMRVVASVRLSDFFDTWMIDSLRDLEGGRGVRLNILSEETRCDPADGLNCEVLLYRPAADGSGATDAAVTLADLQISLFPVPDVMLFHLAPKLARRVFAALLPVMAGSSSFCGPDAHRPTGSGVHHCDFAATTTVPQPAVERINFPAPFPGAHDTADIPLLRVASILLGNVTGVPGMAFTIDMPPATGLEFLIDFTLGLNSAFGSAMAQSNMGELLAPFTKLFVDPATLKHFLHHFAPSVVKHTTYHDFFANVLTLVSLLLPSVDGDGAAAGVVSFLNQALHTIRFARDPETGAEKTLGNFIGYIGSSPAHTSMGAALFIRNMVCDSRGVYCELIPWRAEGGQRASTPALKNGIGLSALRVSPSALGGVLVNLVTPLVALPLNSVIQNVVVGKLCGSVAEGDACHFKIPQGREVDKGPPTALIITYCIVVPFLTAAVTLYQVRRHRRSPCFYTATAQPVRLRRVIIEDACYTFVVMTLVFLYITSNLTTAVSVSVGQEFIVYSFKLMNTVEDMWASGLRFIGAFVMVFSGIYPYIKLAVLMVIPVLLQQPTHVIVSVIDGLGKFSFIDTFIMFTLVSGLRIKGVVDVIAWPSYFVFMFATIFSIMAGNYAFDFYRFGTTVRLEPKAREAFLLKHGLVVALAIGEKDEGEAEEEDDDDDVAAEDAVAQQQESPDGATAGVDDLVANHSEGAHETGAFEGGEVNCHGAQESGVSDTTATNSSGSVTHRKLASVAMTGVEVEYSPSLIRNVAPFGDDAEVEDEAQDSSTDCNAQPKTCMDRLRMWTRKVWWPVALPSTAILAALIIPAWVCNCVTFGIEGLGQLIVGPPKSHTLLGLAIGPDLVTAIVAIVTVLIAPVLYAAFYPSSTPIGSWAATDVAVICFLSAVGVNMLVQFMLGDKDGSREVVYCVRAKLHWPALLILLAMIYVWSMQLAHFFKLHKRVPQLFRWLVAKWRGDSAKADHSESAEAEDSPRHP